MAAPVSFCTALSEARSEHMNYSDVVSYAPLTKNPVQICAHHFVNYETYQDLITRGRHDCPACTIPMYAPPIPAPLQKKIIARIGANLEYDTLLRNKRDYLKEAVSLVANIPYYLTPIITLAVSRIIPNIVKVVEPAFEPTWWQRNWHGLESRPAVTVEVEDAATLYRVAGYTLLASTMVMALAKVAWNRR